MKHKKLLLFVFLLLIVPFVSGVVLANVIKDGADSIEPAPGEVLGGGEVVHLVVNGTINPAITDYFADGLALAESTGARALLIELDTPGGLLSSTKDIVKLLLNAPVPVIVYVSPSGASATSAGVFITLSAHIAAMADGTHIGAAHPVTIGGGGKPKDPFSTDGDKETGDKEEQAEGTGKGFRSQEEIMGEKIENYAVSFIESIAEKRKRNAEWAIEAVRRSASITSSDALEKKVIDLVAKNIPELLSMVDGREVDLPTGTHKLSTKGSVLRSLDMNLKQKLVNILSTPNIAFLLLSLGSLGITMEVFKPGAIFPGVFGTICFLTGCVSLQILPFNYAGLALLVVALGLFVAELFITSFGLLSLGGVVSLVLGGILLFNTPESDIGVGLDVVLSVAFAMGLFFILVAYFLFKAHKLAPSTGLEGMLGKRGEALADFTDRGKVFIGGEYWDATGDGTIKKGDDVVVLGVEERMKLRVEKV